MDFNLITILTLLFVAVLFTFLGVGLGRRSKTTNAYYDKIRKEADELREQLREAEAQLRAKAKP